MITVIDMASGELTCSSTAAQVKRPITAREDERPIPALALQEVQPEVNTQAMPPEFADVPVAAILAKFGWPRHR